MLEKNLKSPLDCKDIKPVNPKGNQFWMFIERTNVEAEAPIIWPPDGKNWLTGKNPHAGKDWRQEEKGVTGWMASLTWWTWIWASSGSWWWTGKPGVLQSMGLQRVGHDWTTEQNWTDAEAPVLWPPDEKSQLTGKDPGAGKDWRQEEEMTEDKMVGWHHQFNGHEFDQTLGDGERQGSLMLTLEC